eukprot:8294750-Karenia_brevis.AAC.1
MGSTPVAYSGEYGSMEGRQTVPRPEMTAAMRALLAMEQYGLGVTALTIWSDSKSVVSGYSKGKAHTLKAMLVTDWEEIWDKALLPGGQPYKSRKSRPIQLMRL